jgi:hypothetical protein
MLVLANLPGSQSHPEDRDEEQQAEQESPEHAPGRSGADRVMGGVDVVAAVRVPHDHRDRVRLDDQVGCQAACLAGGGVRGRFIRVSDGDQVRHGVPLPGVISVRRSRRWSCEEP